MKHGSLPPGWKLVELLPDDPKAIRHAKEAHEIAKVILATSPREKRYVPTHFNGKPISDLSPSEAEEFNLSLQPESTRQALIAQKQRKIEDDGEHFLRPMPKEEEWKRDHEKKRDLDAVEALIYKGMQRTEKNTLGQSLKPSVDAEKRDRGVEAFTYSRPANPSDEDLKRLKELTPMKAVIAAPEPPKEKPKRKWWKFWVNQTRPLTDEEWNDYWGKN